MNNNVDPAITPTTRVLSHKQEIANFTVRGALTTAVFFLALDATGVWAFISWFSFVYLLYGLGVDYKRVLDRPEEPRFTIMKP